MAASAAASGQAVCGLDQWGASARHGHGDVAVVYVSAGAAGKRQCACPVSMQAGCGKCIRPPSQQVHPECSSRPHSPVGMLMQDPPSCAVSGDAPQRWTRLVQDCDQGPGKAPTRRIHAEDVADLLRHLTGAGFPDEHVRAALQARALPCARSSWVPSHGKHAGDLVP